MYKNEQIINDGNTSSDQLFNFKNKTDIQMKSNINKPHNFIKEVLKENGQKITLSICQNQLIVNENKEDNNILFENHFKKKISAMTESNKYLKFNAHFHNNSLKKNRKSSLMSLNRKDPLIFLKSFKKFVDKTIYGKTLEKIKYCDISLSILSILSFFIILFDNEIYIAKSKEFLDKMHYTNENENAFELLKQINYRKISNVENILRMINIIISIFSILILIIKYNNQLILNKKEKPILSSNLKFTLFLEILLCLCVYPPKINTIIYITTTDNIFLFSLNSLFLLIHIIKLYNIFRLIRAISKYNTLLSKIICETYKIQSGMKFIIKSELNDKKLTIIIILFCFNCLAFSAVIKDFECFAYNKKTILIGKKGLNDLQNYFNILWLTLITITSVSYGDEYPRSHFGRFLIFIISFFGLFCLGFIISIISEKSEFTPNEKKSYLKLKKIFSSENQLHKAGNLIKTILFIVKNFKCKNDENKKSNFQEKICLILKLRAESKLFRNNLHISRTYSMPIDDIVQTMENKLFYNLLDINNNLENIDTIENDFKIINENQNFILEKLKNINFFQDNICKFLVENHNKNFLAKIRINSKRNENVKYYSLCSFQLLSPKPHNKYRIIKNNKGFLTPTVYKTKRKYKNKKSTNTLSKFNNSLLGSLINFDNNNNNNKKKTVKHKNEYRLKKKLSKIKTPTNQKKIILSYIEKNLKLKCNSSPELFSIKKNKKKEEGNIKYDYQKMFNSNI